MRRLCRQENNCSAAAAVDPRIRLLAAALLLALVVSSSGNVFPWLVAGTCLPAALITGMKPRLLCLRMLHPLFIVVMILALKIFLGNGDATVLFRIAGIAVSIHQGGLHEGVHIVSRILGAVSVAVLLGQVMTFTETMAALAWLRIPRGLVDVSLLAWRSLFMLYDDAGVVYTAQKNRLGYCGLRRSLRSFGSMAGMLTIRAFDGSQSMTTAMTQRGYDGTLPQLRESRPSYHQFFGLFVFAIAAAFAWKLQN